MKMKMQIENLFKLLENDNEESFQIIETLK